MQTYFLVYMALRHCLLMSRKIDDVIPKAGVLYSVCKQLNIQTELRYCFIMRLCNVRCEVVEPQNWHT